MRRKRIKKPVSLERQLQIKCVKWFWRTYTYNDGILYSSLNGAFLKPMVAVKMKQEGMYSGVADLTLECASGVKYIELKRPKVYGISDKTGKRIIKKDGGTLSDNQKRFRDCVVRWGRTYHVVDNIDDFKEIVKKALDTSKQVR